MLKWLLISGIPNSEHSCPLIWKLQDKTVGCINLRSHNFHMIYYIKIIIDKPIPKQATKYSEMPTMNTKSQELPKRDLPRRRSEQTGGMFHCRCLLRVNLHEKPTEIPGQTPWRIAPYCQNFTMFVDSLKSWYIYIYSRCWLNRHLCKSKSPFFLVKLSSWHVTTTVMTVPSSVQRNDPPAETGRTWGNKRTSTKF